MFKILIAHQNHMVIVEFETRDKADFAYAQVNSFSPYGHAVKLYR